MTFVPSHRSYPNKIALVLFLTSLLPLTGTNPAEAQKRLRVRSHRATATAAPAAPAPPAPSPSSAPPEPKVADLLTRTNADRAANGLPALRWDNRLASLATQWSDDMATNGFRHRSLSALGIGAGEYADMRVISENIAMGGATNTGTLHDLLMRSPGHLANIMDGNVDMVGIGATCDPQGQLWITVNFAGDGAGVVPDAPGGQRATGPSGGFGC